MVLSFTTSFSIFSTLQRMDWLSVQRVINSRSKCMTNISFRYNHCILVNCKFSGMVCCPIASDLMVHRMSLVQKPDGSSNESGPKNFADINLFRGSKNLGRKRNNFNFFGYFRIRSNGEKPTNRLLVRLSAPRPWLCAAIDQRPTFFLIDCSLRNQFKSLFNFCFLV